MTPQLTFMYIHGHNTISHFENSRTLLFKVFCYATLLTLARTHYAAFFWFVIVFLEWQKKEIDEERQQQKGHSAQTAAVSVPLALARRGRTALTAANRLQQLLTREKRRVVKKMRAALRKIHFSKKYLTKVGFSQHVLRADGMKIWWERRRNHGRIPPNIAARANTKNMNIVRIFRI